MTAICFNSEDAMKEAYALVKDGFDGFRAYKNGRIHAVGSLSAIPESCFKIVLLLPSGKAVYLVSLLVLMKKEDFYINKMHPMNTDVIFGQESILYRYSNMFADLFKASCDMPNEINGAEGIMYYEKGLLVKGSSLVAVS